MPVTNCDITEGLVSKLAQRKYYEAYDDRYRQVHAAGHSWFGESASPIVGQIIEKYDIRPGNLLLELGCGEGRDALPLLQRGFSLLATDISEEAIRYCRERFPAYGQNFSVLDCVKESLDGKFDFIFAIAVVHMLVENADRDGFYHFVCSHLTPSGIGLVCSMGDGTVQMRSDAQQAFALQERDLRGKKVQVAGTSCAMVDYETFGQELIRNGLRILEMGQTAVPGEFSQMMYAVVRRDDGEDDLSDILKAHAAQYPKMQPQDAVKLIYQNEFGAGHLIQNEEMALQYLRKEYDVVRKDTAGIREESIGNGISRIYLASLTREDLRKLGQDFLHCAKIHTGSQERFVQRLTLLRGLTEQGIFAFSLEQLDAYLLEYEKAGYPMVSHSEIYRNAYKPAYRIACR